eukprot:6303836-Prymnesium_polylepis.1
MAGAPRSQHEAGLLEEPENGERADKPTRLVIVFEPDRQVRIAGHQAAVEQQLGKKAGPVLGLLPGRAVDHCSEHY